MSSIVVLATPYLSKHASAASMRRSLAAWGSLGNVAALLRANGSSVLGCQYGTQPIGQRTFYVSSRAGGSTGPDVGQHLVDDAVLLGVVGAHDAVAVGVPAYPLDGLAGVVGEDLL